MYTIWGGMVDIYGAPNWTKVHESSKKPYFRLIPAWSALSMEIPSCSSHQWSAWTRLDSMKQLHSIYCHPPWSAWLQALSMVHPWFIHAASMLTIIHYFLSKSCPPHSPACPCWLVCPGAFFTHQTVETYNMCIKLDKSLVKTPISGWFQPGLGLDSLVQAWTAWSSSKPFKWKKWL